MKNIFITLLFAASGLICGAQSNCNIKKAYAFYTATMPGMAMADENGNTIPPKPYISRFIYFEWIGMVNPQIDKVLYNNKELNATLTKAEGKTVIPGNDVGKNKDYVIKVQRYNSLWKIELQPTGADLMPAQDCGNIVIKTKWKTCSVKLLKETKLETLPGY